MLNGTRGYDIYETLRRYCENKNERTDYERLIGKSMQTSMPKTVKEELLYIMLLVSMILIWLSFFSMQERTLMPKTIWGGLHYIMLLVSITLIWLNFFSMQELKLI